MDSGAIPDLDLYTDQVHEQRGPPRGTLSYGGHFSPPHVVEVLSQVSRHNFCL